MRNGKNVRSAVIFLALLILSASSVHAQTPGQIPVFDQPGTGACNNAGGSDCIDSVITQDSSGNIGIGTNAPAAKLDVAGGNVHLENSTPTSGNILKGINLFLHNFGDSNTFLGENAGNLTMSGAHNTGIGLQGLVSNTTGYRNTALGRSALQSNTEGYDNTASGALALANNSTARNNTAIGASALFSNTIGEQNTAIGASALLNNTIGFSNTAIGVEALYNNTSGYNAAIGFRALHGNTTGSLNTAIGFGADVCASCGNLINATAIGANASVNASNKIRLGSLSVTVVEGPPYSTVSDKNAKENFKSVDAEGVLQKIRGMNVTSWNYIGQDAKQFRHYGPVAQDFFAAFGDDGVGTIGSPTTITSTDINGVLLLAVQALEKRTAELATLKAENADLKARLEKLERSIGTLVVKAE